MKRVDVDLSMLTPEELAQFEKDPTTLNFGNENVALYLRYSSDRQSEQSIEGQLRDCIAFCKRKEYRIRAIYVDRAVSARGHAEKRLQFQQMLKDSAKQHWEIAVVWKLDRFARNREDSAIYKMRLRKNGVRVISATEDIPQTPEGSILESVLEGIAEYYSADLSQKITRGQTESALKGQFLGGAVPLGYTVKDHKLVIDPQTAPIVREAFERYAAGESVADIHRTFNAKGYRTASGGKFNRSSFVCMFKNKKYYGLYEYRDIVIENAIPAIIDKGLFDDVQSRLRKVAEAPARGKAKVEYLLSGKIFCGHCGAPMNGESGTSPKGIVHNYYSCYNRKRTRTCKKKPLRKDYIETIVAKEAVSMLNDETIEELANVAIAQSEQDLIENTRIPELSTRLADVEQSILNITKAVEKGVASDTLLNRLVELESEKKEITKLLLEEEKFVYRLDKYQIIYWLEQFKGGNIEDEDYKRKLINLLVNSVTVWDEPDGYKITTAFNLTSRPNHTFRVDSLSFPAHDATFGYDKTHSTIKEEETPVSSSFILQMNGLNR